jgi:putative ABC transport system permease protein
MRLLLRQVRSHVPILVLLGVSMALFAAGVTVLPRIIAAVAEARFTAAFAVDADVPPDITVSGHLDELSEPTTFGRDLTAALDRYPESVDPPLGAALGDPDWEVVFEPMHATPPTQDGDSLLVSLGIWPTLDEHAAFMAGAAPRAWDGTGPLEVAITQASASRMGLSTGDQIATDLAVMRVSGIVIAADSSTPDAAEKFAAPQEELLATGAVAVTISAWMDQGGIPGVSGLFSRAVLTAVYPVSGSGLHSTDIPPLSQALRAATSRGMPIPNYPSMNVNSRLAVVLDRLAADAAAISAIVALVASAPLGALGATVLLAAQAFNARRVRARVLMNARGARSSRLFGEGAAETALAVVPGTIIGVAAASASMPVQGVADAAVPALVAGCGVVIIGGILAVRAAASASAHPAVRRSAEVLILIGAAIAATMLVRRGLVTTSTGVDPLLAVVPLLVALAVSVVLVRLLPLALSLIQRVFDRGRGALALVGVARLVRGSTLGFAAMLSIVVAVSATTLSLTLGSALEAGAESDARTRVGADLRIDASATGLPSVAGITSLDGVAGAVIVSTLRGAGIAEDGRFRPADIFVANTAELAEVRPDLPLPGESGEVAAVVSESLVSDPAGALTIGEAGIAAEEVAAMDALPNGNRAWVLIDDSALQALGDPPITPVWMLVRTSPHSSPAAIAQMIRARFGEDLGVLDTDRVASGTRAAPAFSAVTGILVTASAVSILLALLAVLLSVLAAAGERTRTVAAMRMLGMPARGSAVIVLWEVLPGTTAATLAGAALGLGLAPIVASAADLGSVVGGGVIVLAPPTTAIMIGATAFLATAVVCAATAARVTRNSPLAAIVRTGAI